MAVKGDGRKMEAHTEAARVTLKDIASRLGIAPSTVSNAYNRPDQLSDELREKILDTATKLGYTGPDPAARGLRKGVSNVIGVAFPGSLSYAFTDPAAAQFIEGIAREVEGAGYALLLICTPYVTTQNSAPGSGRGAGDSKPVSGATDVLPITTANVDGLVVHCFDNEDPLYKAALDRRLPTVMVDNPGVEGVPHVSIDDFGGAREAAEYLLALGHRRLGIVSMEFDREAVGRIADAERQAQVAYVSVRARLAGYRAAAEAAGLDWNRDVVVYECGDNRHVDGAEAAAALLALRPRPTALLAMSDQLALGALAHLRREGVAVPSEVAVVGFDDQVAAAYSTPPLTTVHQPTVEKGRQAGRLLLAQLRGEKTPASVQLPTNLVVRGSA